MAGLRAGIVDLEASPSYLMLTGGGLGPVTTAKVGQAAGRAEQVWPALEAAAAAVAEVRDLLDEGGLRGDSGRRVRELLTGRWVQVPDRVGMLTDERASIGELLDRVRRGYDELRPLVAEIESLWQTVLPRIDAARTTLARLTGEVEGLGVPEPLIARAQALADDLADRLVTDPLAVVAGDGDQLDEAVAEAAKQVSSLLSSHASLDDDLAGTEEQLARLRLLRNRAAAAGDRARAKIADPDGLVQVPSASVLDGTNGLGERLDALFETAPDAAWNQRRSLLDQWLRTATQLERQLQRALDTNQAPLDTRDELRGRLTAYQAKISAVGRAEDLELTDLVDEARQELYTAPTDLNDAATAIDDLAGRLRS